MGLVELGQSHAHLDPDLGLLFELHSPFEHVGQPLGVVRRREEPVERLVRRAVVGLLVRRALVVFDGALRVRQLLLPEPAEPAKELCSGVWLVSAFELLLVNP